MDQMKIFLFGATGGTGVQVLAKLLEANHKVIALVRNPDDIEDITHKNLITIKGSVFNPETYQHKLKNCDLVISALGTGTSLKKTEIYSKGGQLIIEAMRRANLKKFNNAYCCSF